MSTQIPLVSALLVAQNRPQIWESIASFAGQTYANRELVVVIDDPNPEFHQVLHERQASVPGMRVIIVPEQKPLGALRNISMEEAKGDYLVQWDDDDLSAPNRIEWQLREMLVAKSKVSYLSEYTHHFLNDDRRVPCRWHNGFPGTLMFHSSVSAKYQELPKHEDTFFKLKLREMGVPMVVLENEPELFTYRFHGTNTWSHEYHLDNADSHMKL